MNDIKGTLIRMIESKLFDRTGWYCKINKFRYDKVSDLYKIEGKIYQCKKKVDPLNFTGHFSDTGINIYVSDGTEYSL